MSATRARDLLHSWNPGPATPAMERFRRVRLEDDVREALQNVRAHRPTLDQRRELLDRSARVGVQVTLLGFPAASTRERDECAALVAHLTAQASDLRPVLMARCELSDLRAILDIQQATGAALTADIYLATSPIRAAVEGWTLTDMLQRLEATAALAAAEGLDFRVALEDSTRTPPADLTRCVQVAIGLGTGCIVVNDTVGDCLPAGAVHHTSTVREVLERAGVEVDIAWHGHNDKGLALANSLAAIEAGATLISGTFLGVGERTGNLALEQLVVVLAGAGSTMYDVSELAAMCDATAAALGIDVPAHQPIVGQDAYSTATGTHAAAILKARQLGADFEDATYSAVSATALGRRQQLLIGPNSGRAAVRAALEDLGLPSDASTVATVLAYCENRVRNLLTTGELRDIVAALARRGGVA